MNFFARTRVIVHGFVRPIFLKVYLIPIVAGVGGLIPFSLANIFQTATLIFQSNSLVHKCLEIWKGVYD